MTIVCRWYLIGIFFVLCTINVLESSKLPYAETEDTFSVTKRNDQSNSTEEFEELTALKVEDENIESLVSVVHVTVKPKVDATVGPDFLSENSTTNPNDEEVNSTNSNIKEVHVPSGGSGVTEGGSGGTTIYVVGIIGILPAAGIIAWCIRYFWKRNKKSLQYNKRAKKKGAKSSRSNRERTNGRVQYSRSASINTLDLDISSSRNRNNSHNHDNNVSDETSQNTDEPRLKKAQSIWEFARQNLRLKNVLGEGNFGLVWKAEADNICGINGTVLVAVKTVKENSSEKEKEDLLNEMTIMKKICCHPNVVTMLGCCRDQEPYLLILEYVMYGKLLTYLRDHRSKKNYYNFSDDACVLTSQDLTTFAFHVARGMEYLSSKGILHRDLAARNILVDHTKTCKIADFGLSKTIKSGDSEMYEQKTKAALPIRWMAPESLFFSVFTIKSDVWSFGILMWEIVTLGSTPYPGMGARDVIREVREGLTPEKPHHCKPELYSIMKSCWAKDAEQRPYFSNLVDDLGQLLERQTGYIDLENFPDNCYFNMYHSSGEKV